MNKFTIMWRTRTDALVDFSEFLEENKWVGYTTHYSEK